MRVIKDNTVEYERFHNSLKYISRIQHPADEVKIFSPAGKKRSGEEEDRFTYFFKYIYLLQNKMNDTVSLSEISDALLDAVRRIISAKEAEFFLFDEHKLNLNPVFNKENKNTSEFINNIHREEILDWIFETGKPTIIPDIESYTASGSKLNYLIIPIFEKGERLGALSILTSLSTISETATEMNVLPVIIGMVLPKVRYILKSEELKNAYYDLQSYQSKLSNDYKLSAVGEMTMGIADNILSPLQIILSNADMIKEKVDDGDAEQLDSIKSQVKKIEQLVNRLIKFSNINKVNKKVEPCNINELIENYHQITLSAFKSNNYEVIHDLSENLPPVITHPDQINQLLSNVVSVLKSAKSSSGGILIQTKFIKDNIIVRFISTDYIKGIANDSDTSQKSVMRIIENLMKKHEGKAEFESTESHGTTIALSFPLKRKIRK